MLFLRHFPTLDRSLSLSPHPLWLLRLRFHLRVSILASPRVSPPLLPSVSLGLLPLRCLRFSPPSSPLTRPRFILIPLRMCISSAPNSLSPSLPPVCPICSPRLCVHRRSSFPRSSFDSRFYRPGFGARFCGPRVAPKRPHTTPPERQRTQGRDRHINIS